MLSQIVAITGLNLRSVPQRWGPSLVIVIGLAGVVAVFTALLAMAQGFQTTLQDAGRADNAIILRGGSGAELNSGFGGDTADLIRLGPGIRKGADGRPLASGELIVISELLKKGETRNGANVTLRGVEPAAFELRPQLRIVEGRKFEPGLREIIVGTGIARQFAGAGVGETIRMRGSDWTVVGHFESGDANDSEMWTDAGTAQSAFNRGNGFSAVRVGLESPAALDTLKAALTSDPRLTVEVLDEREYYSAQTKQFRQTISVLAGVVTFIMALGAIFAALNTMYAAVATRTREIATLRAIGFGALPVLVSVMIEAIVLAAIGGLVGAGLAWLLFDNLSVSTLGQNFTQVVFAFQVSGALVLAGFVIAVLIGSIGGLLPAIRAARMKVTTALREQ
ncbi:ABC transporter permease [Chiayiivirga flava]|uniref:Putative ABC transport system permease protein n=1 Tax=Chiayiivirga flava TaxID=659595 RepID=A0A7W8DAN1_9GAMM|nr:ABC transporter permease [Chiayiivirga flava]MBB5209626.1 putative ABC transport system permease protein [Chiayiivirga flava]